MGKKGQLEGGAFGSSRRLPTHRQNKKQPSTRKMPTKSEIEEEATRLFMLEGHDISTNLPEREELSEGGFLKEAQHRLMSSGEDEVPQSQARAEQTQYVDTMAQELGLKVIPKEDLAVLKRKTGIEHVDGWDIPEPKPPKKVVEAKKEPPKPKIGQIFKIKEPDGSFTYVEVQKPQSWVKLGKGEVYVATRTPYSTSIYGQIETAGKIAERKLIPLSMSEERKIVPKLRETQRKGVELSKLHYRAKKATEVPHVTPKPKWKITSKQSADLADYYISKCGEEGVPYDKSKFEKVLSPDKTFKQHKEALNALVMREAKPKGRTVFVRVRFQKDIPKVVGSDMNVYGPFKKGRVYAVPKDNARAFMKLKVALATRKEAEKPTLKQMFKGEVLTPYVEARKVKPLVGPEPTKKVIAKPEKAPKPKLKPERERAIVRHDKKHISILCAQGHLIEWHKLDRSYGGSSLESELGSRHYGDRFDRLAWACKGAGHEPKKKPLPKKVTPKPKKKIVKPKPETAKPKPKRKRKRLRVGRAGRTTRRFGDGEIISLSDDVWKVKDL